MDKFTLRTSSGWITRAVQVLSFFHPLSLLDGFNESKITSAEANPTTPGSPSVFTLTTSPSEFVVSCVGLSERYSPPENVNVSPALSVGAVSGQSLL